MMMGWNCGAWGDAALPQRGKGRCGVRRRRCLPRWGKGAAVWRAWFWLVRGEMLFMRRFALQEGLAGAPGGGEKPLCVFARILQGLADAPGARGDGGDGRFARGENCPLFPRPPRFRNHPAGRPAGSARTRPRDQGRLSSKCNSLEEDIERRAPVETFAGPVVDQIKDALKLRL